MTHDPRIEALARVWTPHIFCGLETNEGRGLPDLQYDNLPPDWQQRMREMASDGLHALTRAGLRVVPAEPSDKDVERVARASWDEREKLANGYKLNGNVWWDDADVPQNMRDTYRLVARAAIAAFLGPDQ